MWVGVPELNDGILTIKNTRKKGRGFLSTTYLNKNTYPQAVVI